MKKINSKTTSFQGIYSIEASRLSRKHNSVINNLNHYLDTVNADSYAKTNKVVAVYEKSFDKKENKTFITYIIPDSLNNLFEKKLKRKNVKFKTIV